MIRLTNVRHGPGYFQPAGTELDLPPDEERELIARGRAVRVEQMTRQAPENASRDFKRDTRGRQRR